MDKIDHNKGLRDANNSAFTELFQKFVSSLQTFFSVVFIDINFYLREEFNQKK